MNKTCSRDDKLTKTKVLNVLDQLRCEVQADQSQGFVLLKVVSRENDGFSSTIMVNDVQGTEIMDLVWMLLDQTGVIDLFIKTILAHLIKGNALKCIKTH